MKRLLVLVLLCVVSVTTQAQNVLHFVKAFPIGDTEYLGKGYGSEAVSMLAQFGFNDLNLHRIYLQVFASNQRAINAYNKCGFKQEGIARESAFIDGSWEDIITMGILEHG